MNYATLNKRLTRSKRNLTKQIHPDRLNLKDIKEKGEKYEQLMIEKHKDMKDVLEKYKQLKEEKRVCYYIYIYIFISNIEKTR